MKIAFYAGSCLPIWHDTLEERPLGGIETGVIRLAESLAKKGHEVTVFSAAKGKAPDRRERGVGAVIYRAAPEIKGGERFETLVLVKDWRPVVYNLPAVKVYFWTGDSFDQFANYGFGDRRAVSRLAGFLAVSEYHRRTMCEYSGFPIEKSFVIGNGVHLPWFAKRDESKRNRKRLIYSSAPYRGLALVPKLFLELKDRVPEVELQVFAGLNVYDTDQPFQGPELEHWKRIERVLLRLPNCTVVGNVKQGLLAQAFLQAGLLFYPNTFIETFCITAAEAMAAGCPVLTSDLGALPEIVGPGGLFASGEPGSDEYFRSFLDSAERVLRDDALWEKLAQAGRERAEKEFSWDNAAERFEKAVGVEAGAKS